MKKVAATICVGAMSFTAVPTAFAAEAPVNYQQESEITPYWTAITESVVDFYISNRTASIYAVVKGSATNATGAEIFVELQEKNGSSWSTVDNWSGSGSYKASVSTTKAVTKGKTYRIKVTMQVWEGSKTDKLVDYSNEETA